MGMLIVKSNQELMAEEAAKEELSAEVKKIETQPLSEGLRVELASHIRSAWFAAKQEQRPFRDLMIENLRQKRGEYDAEMQTALTSQDLSDVFVKITGTKCRSLKAWVEEILFQPGTVPFDLDPTPVPTLNSQLEQMAVQTLATQAQAYYGQLAASAQAGQIDPATFQATVEQSIPEFKKRFKRIVSELAKEKAENMKRKIQDQLVEGGFYRALSEVVQDVSDLKAGILAGPIYRKKKVRSLKVGGTKKVGQKTIMGATPVVTEEVIPEWDAVSPFDIYPSPGSTGINDGYLIRKLSLERKDLQALIGLPGFDEVAVRNILGRTATGDSKLREWSWDEQDRLEAEGRETAQYYNWDKIDGIEFNGPISGQTLLDWGMDPKKIPDPLLDYEVVAWLVDTEILKCVLNPDPLGIRKFFKTSFIKNRNAFWGDGLPETIADIQQVCNAVARAIVNNVGMASGPQVEINIDRLLAGENSDRIWPWRIYKVTRDLMATGHAIQFYQPQLHGNELIQIFTTFAKLADEYSGVPAYAHGDPNVGGAGNTSSGLAMLMGASARGVKGVLKNLDDDIIAPAVECQYYENYELDDALEYIGDVKILAKGSSSVQAKEQQALRLVDFSRATANPIDAQIMGLEGRKYVLRETAKSMNLEADKLVPDNPAPLMAPQASPTAGPQTLDNAGNPAQGSAQELFKPMAQ